MEGSDFPSMRELQGRGIGVVAFWEGAMQCLGELRPEFLLAAAPAAPVSRAVLSPSSWCLLSVLGGGGCQAGGTHCSLGLSFLLELIDRLAQESRACAALSK